MINTETHPSLENTPSVAADVSGWDEEWPAWFDHDPELGATIVTASSEHETTPQQLTKTQKVGKAVMKADSVMAGANLLASGSALYHAKPPTEQTVEPEPAELPEIVDGPTDTEADWLNVATETQQKVEAEPEAAVEAHEQWTGAFEQKGYIKEAPRFRDQAHDASRTNTFRYLPRSSISAGDVGPDQQGVELTEHEGLVRLEEFLKEYVEKVRATNVVNNALTDEVKQLYIYRAEGMLELLTFIGEKEYAEAVKGLGDYWKAFLDEDPARQVCIVTGISRNSSKRKSDVYVSERILDTFTDEELERYSGRIVTELGDITAETKDLKVILLDDWTISGESIKGAYDSLVKYEKSKYDACVEVNLLAASQHWVDAGITSSQWDWKKASYKPSPTIPVRAYYRAHTAPETSEEEHAAHISGTHSSVDYDFEEIISVMVHHMNIMAGEPEAGSEGTEMPPLTNIIRTYRYEEPAVVVERNRIIKKRKRVE